MINTPGVHASLRWRSVGDECSLVQQRAMRMRAVAMFGVMAMPAGVDASKLPSDDKAEWERMEGKHPGWFPNRDIRDKVPRHPTCPLTHMRVDAFSESSQGSCLWRREEGRKRRRLDCIVL
jgi:hypothetical protein